MTNRKSMLAGLIGLIQFIGITPSALSDDGFRLSGFGTAALISLDQDDVFFNHPGKQRERQRNDWISASDTLLGVQGSLSLRADTEATVQVIVDEDHKNDVKPRLAWAFLRHDLKPDLTVRAGRLRAPFFMHSDSLNINFAHPWVRPPVEVYGLNPVSELDGVDMLYRMRLGDFNVEVQPYFGYGRVRFPDGSANLDQTGGVSINLSRGDLRVQLGHGEGGFDLHYGDPLYLGTRDYLLATGQADVVGKLSGDDGHTSFSAIGFQWEHDAYQLSGELARRRADKFLANTYAWYLSFAYQAGPVAPFVVAARQNASSQITPDNGDPVLAAYLASRSNNQESLALGVRWDVAPSRAIKMQWTRSWVANDAWGAFFPDGDPRVSTPSGRRIDMLNLSLDFVF